MDLYFIITDFLSLSSLFCSMRKDVFDNLVTFKVIIKSTLNSTELCAQVKFIVKSKLCANGQIPVGCKTITK